MEELKDYKIVLADGSVYPCTGFGARVESVCELVFNTSMAGYQEIISDPSYTYQAVVMSYPVIGNYGIADDDFETKTPTIGALIVRDYNDEPSNFRCTKTLSEILEDNGIPAVYGVDTRKLVRIIREHGSMKVMLAFLETPTEKCVETLNNTEIPKDAVKRVSCRKKWYSRTAHSKLEVVAVDCGIKMNIVRSLNKRGCNVTVVPYNTAAEEIESLNPDGVFFSNGPGDPEDVTETIDLLKSIKGKYPIFGICLGHQLIALACGAKTYKLKFGHRGGNHPVKNLLTGKIEMTSQNHSYAVVPESLIGTPLTVTHVNVLDGTIEGMEDANDKMFSVQYHPESAPGPEDSGYLFDKFVTLMEESKKANGKESKEERE